MKSQFGRNESSAKYVDLSHSETNLMLSSRLLGSGIRLWQQCVSAITGEKAEEN